MDCPANTIGVEDCTHTQDVVLVCTASKDDYMNIVRCMQYSNICTVPMHVYMHRGGVCGVMVCVCVCYVMYTNVIVVPCIYTIL